MNIKKVACVATLLMCVATIFAIKVDEKELEETDGDTNVKFESFTKKTKWNDSLRSIKNIGSILGHPVALDREKFTKEGYGNKNRYAVIHALDPDETSLRDADIIIIGSGAAVDHINNMRHIIASYLTAAYSYEYTDAYTIAILVTIYNAIYRKNIKFFEQRYKKVVMQFLTEDKCGLALHYKEWPGRTQIVIPLYSGTEGNLNSVDLGSITGSKVIKALEVEASENDGAVSGEAIEELKKRVDTLKDRAGEEKGSPIISEDIEDALWPRALLFGLCTLLLGTAVALGVINLSTYKKINESSNTQLLVSSTQPETYINNFDLKRGIIIAGGVFITTAFVLTLLSLTEVLFAPINRAFVIGTSLLMCCGAVSVVFLVQMLGDMHKRLEAVGMAHINPPGIDTGDDSTV